MIMMLECFVKQYFFLCPLGPGFDIQGRVVVTLLPFLANFAYSRTLIVIRNRCRTFPVFCYTTVFAVDHGWFCIQISKRTRSRIFPSLFSPTARFGWAFTSL